MLLYSIVMQICREQYSAVHLKVQYPEPSSTLFCAIQFTLQYTVQYTVQCSTFYISVHIVQQIVVHSNILQHCRVQCSSVEYWRIHCSKVGYCTVHFIRVLTYCKTQYSILLQSTAQYNIVKQTILYSTDYGWLSLMRRGAGWATGH